MFERVFKLSEHKTTVKTEVMAGITTFMTMAYTVVAGYGYSWQVALLAVFIEGLLFIVLSLTNVREAIFNAIPLTLKKGVSVGIGLFIAFIGLQNSGLCVDSATLVGIISFPENFHTAGTVSYNTSPSPRDGLLSRMPSSA